MFTTLSPLFPHQFIHDLFFRENGKAGRIMDGFLKLFSEGAAIACLLLFIAFLKFIVLKIYILPVLFLFFVTVAILAGF